MTPIAAEEMIQLVWTDIEQWYRDKAPRLFSYLAKGATIREITRLEKLTGKPLPVDYVASLQRHNGGGFVHFFEYLSLQEVSRSWELMRTLETKGRFAGLEAFDPAGGLLQNVGWHLGWIPVAEHKSGILICLDLAPGPTGTSGQVLEMDLQEGPSATEYDSFLGWLASFRDDLKQGVYGVDEHGYLIENQAL